MSKLAFGGAEKRKRRKPKSARRIPRIPLTVLAVLALGSLLAGVIAPYDPGEMDSSAISQPPSAAHWFGTDHLGRDLFTLVLYGGRASLTIGLAAALISFLIAAVYGTVSGIAPAAADHILMRITDLILSIPSILLVIFLQAVWGKATVLSLSVLIGAAGWMQMAKVVRSEVRRIRLSEYILAARLMGGGFWYLLLRHMLPNFFQAIVFMAVSGAGSAMITESTLSFLGLGLPVSVTSWGSLLSMAQDALLSGQWWIVLIPGLVLITALVSIAEVGESMRRGNTRLHSNL